VLRNSCVQILFCIVVWHLSVTSVLHLTAAVECHSLLTAGCLSHGMPGTCCGLPSVLTDTLLHSLDASKKCLSSHKNKVTNFSRFLVFFYIFITGIPRVLEPKRHFAFKRDSKVCDGFIMNIDTTVQSLPFLTQHSTS